MSYNPHMNSRNSPAAIAKAKVRKAAQDIGSMRTKADMIGESLFEKQGDSFGDPARRKSCLVGRRGGKTYGEVADLIVFGLLNPNANMAYVTLYKETAIQILWDNPKTGLRRLNQKFGLGMTMLTTQKVGILPNGSRIALHGAKREQSLDNLRGQAFDKIKIDECKSFSPKRLDQLIEDVLAPTLADYRGQITLMGTPGSVLAGPFFESTRLATFGNHQFRSKLQCRPFAERKKKKWKGDYLWSFHQWSLKDNTALSHLWGEARRTKKLKGWADDDPSWVREWLGLWVVDGSALVYRYDSAYDWAGGQPDGEGWRNILSFYWDASDMVGITVCAYHPRKPGLYNLAAEKIKDCTTDQLASRIYSLESEYGELDAVIGARPGRGKEIIHDLQEHHDIPVLQADMKEIGDLVVLANSDMELGRIHMLKDSELTDEVKKLQWQDPGERIDEESSPSQISTAFLFAWQHSYHRDYRPAQNKPQPGTPEHLNWKQEEALRKADEDYLREQNMSMSDRMLDQLHQEDSQWASLIKDNYNF